ncbi:VPLPA-CTERM sorting domain-containing protein [Desulfovibrio inopinatus]|uniref:VPLPA-CTERM sorting domain-containing protein n=1 Tax=Desulfovibrio inopinatus TaxID=102109 RepID=UPI0003F5F312|nr:VPLPA-CTERM sorting domain-containing protein [Desulfovibrio inopinatus]
MFEKEELIVKKVCLYIMLILFAFPLSAKASIANGDFETGDLSSWERNLVESLLGNADVIDSYTFEDGTTINPYAGNYMAMLGSDTSLINMKRLNKIKQTTKATTSLEFMYNFWSYRHRLYPPSSFEVRVNDDSVFSFSESEIDQSNELNSTGWTYVSLDLSDYIGEDSITISFLAGDEYGVCSPTGVFLDNINVHATPIPGAIWLFGTGMLGLWGMRRKKIGCART